MSTTKIISVANSKGGVGKSVITSVIANYLHNKTDLSVAVIDCDDQQRSLYDMRQAEIDEIKGKERDLLYPLGKVNPADFPEAFEGIYEGQYDVLLVDLPGTLSQKGVISTLCFAELILIPVAMSQTEIHGTIEFLKVLRKQVLSLKEKEGVPTRIFGVWNKVQPMLREFKQDKTTYEELIGIQFLQNYVPYSQISFGKNVSTTTHYKFDGKQEPVFQSMLAEIQHLINPVTL